MQYCRKVAAGGGIHHEHLQRQEIPPEPAFVVQTSILQLLQDRKPADALELLWNNPILSEDRKEYLFQKLFGGER